MLTRPPFVAPPQRQPPRSFSHGLTIETGPHDARVGPSRLSHVRSASGPQPPTITDRPYASQPITAIELDLDLDDRPKKRARVDADLDLVTSPQPLEQDEDELHRTMPGAPLALPPKAHLPVRRRTQRQRLAELAACKADGLTPPAIGVRVPPTKGVADFDPWHGQHPEDILNEHVVKNGYSEKAPSPNQNESNTAKLAIWPMLSQKNNITLQTLSLLYTQVLEKRQHIGRCTAPSSFKPPPRVTVTDTKREAWLRDLANQSIPLRRQSRTIPHGIRGKLLLDQCVAKAVPLQRAIWLAKCVGANELRAFRRKGVAGSVAAQGEAKWIRDWTMSTEQFFDETMRSSGQPGWRQRIEYAVKAVTALYGEGLLEREHFLDWTVASLAASDLERVPCWLLLTQICWNDIVGYGRRGRLLAKALLAHLSTVKQNAFTAQDNLRRHLQNQLHSMLKKAEHCLVMPSHWMKHRDLVLELADGTTFQRLCRRNERLIEPTAESIQSVCHPTVRLYDLLDQSEFHSDAQQLARECLSAMPDIRGLVHAVVSWASSRYRYGRYRVVLAEQIIGALHKLGQDTDGALLGFLAKTPSVDILQNDVHAIIAGLARSDSFSAGRYMKWLITSGAMSRDDAGGMATGLLSALPHEHLPQHLQNTRASLMARLHDQNSTEYITPADNSLDAILADESLAHELSDLVASLQPAAIAGLAPWAKVRMADQKGTAMSLHTFTVLRSVLEACQSTALLAQLLDSALSTEDFTILASLADTVSLQGHELAIKSKLDSLTDACIERYRVLRTQQPLERSSIFALSSLSARLDRASAVKLLKNDLLIYERQHLSAVCSPASDNVISMHAGSMDSDDEIEAVFASGNMMDEQLMRRIFARIAQRVEKQTAGTAAHAPACRWFVHLRSLDHSNFDSMITAYCTQLFTSEMSALPAAVYVLIAADCISIDMLVNCLQDVTPAVSRLAVLRLLAGPLSMQHALSNAEQYHLDVQRSDYCREYCNTVAKLLASTTTADCATDADWMTALSVRLSGRPVEIDLATIYQAVLRNVDPAKFVGTITPAEAISNATALNVRFCCACLDATTSSNDTQDAVVSAIMADSPIWPAILRGCSREIIKEVHTWALDHLLDDKAGPGRRFSSVLDLTHILLKQPVDQSLLGSLANKLKTLPKLLSQGSDTNSTLSRLETLLHITVLCGQSMATDGDSAMQGRALIVLALCSILSAPALEGNTSLSEHVADVANIFIDRLPMEVVRRLEKSAQNANLTKRSIMACFGESKQTNAWLALASAQQSSQPPRMLLKPGQPSRSQPLPAMRRPGQNVELKYSTYNTRAWEVMSDPTPVIGENDSSISLALFGARKV